MTYYLPGAKRNNFETSSYALNDHHYAKRLEESQRKNLKFYTAYFKFCELILCAICVAMSLVFQLWSILEGDIVAHFTFEFREKVVTHVNTNASEKGQAKIEDPRQKYLEYFLKLFTEYKHFTSYGLKYMFIYIVAIATHLGLILYFSWLLLDDMTDMFYPETYKSLIMLAFHDDIKQLRTDRLAELFPDSFSCLISYTGISGTIVDASVMCTSITNTWSKKIHVISFMFSWFMVFALILDALWLLLAVYSLPISRSSGNKKVQKFLRTFCFGKRLLYILFGKNIDALFWDDMLVSLYEDKK